jgi:hypothetical protein
MNIPVNYLILLGLHQNSIVRVRVGKVSPRNWVRRHVALLRRSLAAD